MSPAWLFAGAVIVGMVHIVGAVTVGVSRSSERWAVWGAGLTIMAGLYGAMAWSYSGLLDGTRNADEHLDLVTVLGFPLLLWPGIVVTAHLWWMLTQQRAQEEVLRAVLEAETIKRTAGR